MVNSVNQIDKVSSPFLQELQQSKPTGKPQESFSQTLKNAIHKMNEAEFETNQKTEALAKGQLNDLHDVMITAQKSSIVVETTVQVQRKVIDAYNEIMRMQV